MNAKSNLEGQLVGLLNDLRATRGALDGHVTPETVSIVRSWLQEDIDKVREMIAETRRPSTVVDRVAAYWTAGH